jgi:hypothetical protein
MDEINNSANVTQHIKRSKSEELSMLFDKGIDSDFVINVGDKKIHVNKWVLNLNSPVFERMLESNFTEKASSEVDIVDIEYELMYQLLRFMYTKSVSPVFKTMSDRLLIAANKYQMEELVKVCESTLCDNLLSDNAAATYMLAYQHGTWEFRRNVRVFIYRRLPSVIQSNGWETLANNSEVLNTFISGSAARFFIIVHINGFEKLRKTAKEYIMEQLPLGLAETQEWKKMFYYPLLLNEFLVSSYNKK